MRNLTDFVVYGGSLMAFALSWILLLRWVRRDARRRAMGRAARLGWTALVGLTWGLGAMVYLLARAERRDALSETPCEPPVAPAPLTPAGYHQALTDGPPVPEGEVTEIPISELELVVVGGVAPALTYRLGHGFSLIGRAPDVEEGARPISIEGDPSISRNHLAVECDDHRLYVRNLSSQRSSWVDGRRIPADKRVTIKPESELRLGSTLFVLKHNDLAIHAEPATPAPLPIYRLHGMAGSAVGLSRPLNGRRIVIGRTVDCDICLDDKQVSRHHAELYMDGSSYRLSDSGSSNGSFVNDRRIKDKALTAGDVIRIGESEMVFEGVDSEH